ncbi:hypothetical protein JAO73_22545 [Hymenobacter sp. BT523]|uniref:hypothetical protein n=1 Tax=Hymenobacter sp. BT523 TaxID=2795725 RepID=UPI0018EA46BD|nr:hypothetical protein [Hymenobacter sp. BT523]MBJ6111817.1 hypothetical protein [Hymenobacter sp. BT523]
MNQFLRFVGLSSVALQLLAGPLGAWAQTGGVTVGAAGAPDASAALEVRSTTQGLLLPRLTLAQRNAVAAPAAGLVLYQTDNAPGLYAYDGTAWVRLGGDNLGSHAATQNLNLQAYALVGTSESVGPAVGVGVTPRGGLNLGQNTQQLFVGYQAGAATTGTYNHFVGCLSGAANTTGSYNYFAGFRSGGSNTTGDYNHFSGLNSGYSNTTGTMNHVEGHNAGYNSTTGSYNQFIGFQSGYHNATGSGNFFSGLRSGFANLDGRDNHFEGYQSGYANVSGNANTFVGASAGANNISGNFNTAFGYEAGPSVNGLAYATAIGYRAKVSQNNSLVLGGTGAYAVSVGIGTTAPVATLDVRGTVALGDRGTVFENLLRQTENLDVGPIGANTTRVEQVRMAGVKPGATVWVSPATGFSSASIAWARVSSLNTVEIGFSSPVATDPAAKDYYITVIQ